MMSKIQLKETTLKVLHLLNNVPNKKKTSAFIAGKLGIHINTVRNHIAILQSMEVISPMKSYDGQKLYFVNEQFSDLQSNFEGRQ
jgi:predicted ArsR family transcriptional regulator